MKYLDGKIWYHRETQSELLNMKGQRVAFISHYISRDGWVAQIFTSDGEVIFDFANQCREVALNACCENLVKLETNESVNIEVQPIAGGVRHPTGKPEEKGLMLERRDAPRNLVFQCVTCKQRKGEFASENCLHMQPHSWILISENGPLPVPDSLTGTLAGAIVEGLKSDPVKAPSHYRSHPSGVECITIIQHFTLNIGSAMKYLWRAGLKEGNPPLQDLRKALQYIEFEIKRIEENKA